MSAWPPAGRPCSASSDPEHVPSPAERSARQPARRFPARGRRAGPPPRGAATTLRAPRRRRAAAPAAPRAPPRWRACPASPSRWPPACCGWIRRCTAPATPPPPARARPSRCPTAASSCSIRAARWRSAGTCVRAAWRCRRARCCSTSPTPPGGLSGAGRQHRHPRGGHRLRRAARARARRRHRAARTRAGQRGRPLGAAGRRRGDLGRAGRLEPVAAVGAEQAASRPAWKDGKLVFTQTPLAEALAEIARYRRAPVTLADARTADLRISGVFDSAGTDVLLDLLPAILPVTVARAPDDTVTVRARAEP